MASEQPQAARSHVRRSDLAALLHALSVIGMRKLLVAIFDGSLDDDPARLTTIQSVLVMILAISMAAGLYLLVGVHFPNIWYQMFAALVISAILAPVFLYPSYRTSHRLRLANRRIYEQAFTDQLTGLPNLLALSRYIDELLSQYGRRPAFAVHCVEVGNIKLINTSLGHEVGNVLLKTTASRLHDECGQAYFVGRLGEAEFVVVQPGTGCSEEAHKLARQLSAVLRRPYQVRGRTLSLAVTVGTALAPKHGDTTNSLLTAASLALAHAKAHNVERKIFAPRMATLARRRRDIESWLGQALSGEQFSLRFQPIFARIEPQRVVAFEALLRWTLPDGTSIPPDEFIPAAERTGAIIDIGAWVLEQACIACKSWPDDIAVAVNVSTVQLARTDFEGTVRRVLAKTNLEPRRLQLEITETAIVNDTSIVAATLQVLRGLDVSIALDDFGSGYAGLQYLRELPIDKIKVDKSIIDEATVNEKALNILRGVSRIATESGMKVTVEGVDSISKVRLLDVENVADEVQGYFYSPPVTAAEASVFFHDSYNHDQGHSR